MRVSKPSANVPRFLTDLSPALLLFQDSIAIPLGPGRREQEMKCGYETGYPKISRIRESFSTGTILDYRTTRPVLLLRT